MTRTWVTKLAEVLPALEAAAVGQPRADRALVDTHVTAFIAARRDARLDTDIAHLAGVLSPANLLSQLQLLALLQAKTHRAKLPALCAWAADAMQPIIQQFNSRSRRARLMERVAILGQAGQLAPIAELVENRLDVVQDRSGMVSARKRITIIDATIADMTSSLADRTLQTRRVGQDVAVGVGMLACVAALALEIFT